MIKEMGKIIKKLPVVLFRSKEGGFCFEIPEKYSSEAPAYTPPVNIAQDLNLYPTKWSRMLIAHTRLF